VVFLIEVPLMKKNLKPPKTIPETDFMSKIVSVPNHFEVDVTAVPVAAKPPSSSETSQQLL
jgi:hypothetical protein